MEKFEQLIEKINIFCNQYPFVTCISLLDIKIQKRFDRGADNIIPASSIRKLFILAAALSAARHNIIDLNQQIEIKHKRIINTTEVSGCIQFLNPGLKITLMDLIILMIVISDNIATPIVVEYIGIKYLNEYCNKIGCKNTKHLYSRPTTFEPNTPVHNLNHTTMKDVMHLLELLEEGSRNKDIARKVLLSTQDCIKILRILNWQQDDSLFRSMLPLGAQVAYKHGLGVRNLGAAGLFYSSSKPHIILTIMTDQLIIKNKSLHPRASYMVSKIAQMVWKYIQNKS